MMQLRSVLSLTLSLVPVILGACSKSTKYSPSSEVGMHPASAKPSADAAAPAMSATPKFAISKPVAYENPGQGRIGVLAPGTGIPVGEHVPDTQALDLEGRPVTLASLYEQGPILLAFYRGGWCPYCNMEIHSLSA
ncbi:MAG: redoxin domain-containing protein, partial [Polyangiaceae bacterium]